MIFKDEHFFSSYFTILVYGTLLELVSYSESRGNKILTNVYVSISRCTVFYFLDVPRIVSSIPFPVLFPGYIFLLCVMSLLCFILIKSKHFPSFYSAYRFFVFFLHVEFGIVDSKR